MISTILAQANAVVNFSINKDNHHFDEICLFCLNFNLKINC
ncbi:hypothetical protein A1OE_1301 [Candidatus Endolissoclinum faulkneri L2]|uniref:Uncharacterized protein n=1 Tax=Candidatus Endolissoclinum faulkneri L2 TaxID=1193729 RepID=K7YSI3_9PROT|nr:hypothetical protein A1OE_1301 [Candidatus Endolissoclinum faulkneri L2]